MKFIYSAIIALFLFTINTTEANKLHVYTFQANADKTLFINDNCDFTGMNQSETNTTFYLSCDSQKSKFKTSLSYDHEKSFSFNVKYYSDDNNNYAKLIDNEHTGIDWKKLKNINI